RPVGANAYRLTNDLGLWFKTNEDTSTTQAHSKDVYVIDRTSRPDEGYHNTDVFAKTAPDTIKVAKGTSANVPYTFTLDMAPDGAQNPGENFDDGEWSLANLSIHDTLDTDAFDLSTYAIDGNY